MKAAFLLILLATTISLHAQVVGRLDLVFADGHIIKNAKVMSDDPHVLVVLTKDGINTVLKADLNAETRLKVGYDPKADADFIKARELAVKAAAEAKSKAEKEAMIAFRLSSGKGIAKQKPTSSLAANSKWRSSAKSDPDADYIESVRLAKIAADKAEAEAKAKAEAEKAEADKAKAEAIAKAEKEDEIEKSKPRVEITPPPDGALVIKGVYLGMKIDQAIQVLTDAGEGRIKVRRDDEYGEKSGRNQYKIYLKGKNGLPSSSDPGNIYVDAKTNNITKLYLSGTISNFLFNAYDMSSQEFVQDFIDSYHVPRIYPNTLPNGGVLWYYKSDEGWSVTIDRYHMVYVETETPKSARKFN